MQPKAPSSGFSWFPEQASTFAGQVDALYFYLVAVTVFFTVLISGVILVFAVRYRQKSIHDRPERMETSTALEIIWSVIPFILVVIMFFWGAEVFFEQRRTPANAMEISVTGKKWMWKFQHLNGRREINVLHIPINKPVVLRMASEDVIHDVYIPAFRTKQDVLPGRYTTLWFQATKAGVYHLFCNQYCGTQHSNMVGSVVAMEPAAYQAWLYEYSGETPEKAGEALFQKLACNSCHMAGSASRGPELAGILGTRVALASGGAPVLADENYLRESILHPQAKVVAGFQPIMPSFQGVVSEDQVTQLIAYIRSLKPGAGREGGGVIHNTSSQANQADGLATQQAPAPERTPEHQGEPVQGQPSQAGEQQAPQAVTPSETPAAAPAPSPTPQATPAATPQPSPTPAPTPEPTPTPAVTPESTPAAPTTSTETQDQPSTNPAGSAVQ